MNMTAADLYRATPYPVVILPARYGGAYEGGFWIGLHSHGIPPGCIGSDLTCVDWWNTWGDHQAVAVGQSPDDVLAKLITRELKYSEDVLPREAFVDKTDELYSWIGEREAEEE